MVDSRERVGVLLEAISVSTGVLVVGSVLIGVELFAPMRDADGRCYGLVAVMIVRVFVICSDSYDEIRSPFLVELLANTAAYFRGISTGLI